MPRTHRSELDDTREHYRRFAEFEAAGHSAVYEDWALGVADDERMLTRLLHLPAAKRQANLLFAAARHVGAEVGRYAGFRDWTDLHWNEVCAEMMHRSTQTNEAGRCAVLLPELSRIAAPIALIEVGAAAGLCLYPDRYSYDYVTADGTVRLDPKSGPSSVSLRCALSDDSVPLSMPEIVSRTGIDLNPLDVTNPAELTWLNSLIWPEHEQRRIRLAAAARIVAADPPELIAGNLLEAIDEVIAAVPTGRVPVVMHSAVLAYLCDTERTEFVELMQAHDEVVWISNEGRTVLPAISAQVPFDIGGNFVLGVNGQAKAVTGPHGQSRRGMPRTTTRPSDPDRV